MSGNQPIITAAKVHPWVDTKTVVDGAHPIRYGVQIQVDGRWRHFAVGGVAAFFDTADLAQANADEIMRQVAPASTTLPSNPAPR